MALICDRNNVYEARLMAYNFIKTQNDEQTAS